MLKIVDLKKNYGTVHALRGVSLEIKKGEFVSIMERVAVENPPCYTVCRVFLNRLRAQLNLMISLCLFLVMINVQKFSVNKWVLFSVF